MKEALVIHEAMTLQNVREEHVQLIDEWYRFGNKLCTIGDLAHVMLKNHEFYSADEEKIAIVPAIIQLSDLMHHNNRSFTLNEILFKAETSGLLQLPPPFLISFGIQFNFPPITIPEAEMKHLRIGMNPIPVPKWGNHVFSLSEENKMITMAKANSFLPHEYFLFCEGIERL